MTLRLIAGGAPSPVEFPLFDSILDRSGKRQLQRLVSLVATARGEFVAKQGDIGRELLVLSEGVLKLWKALPEGRRQIVAFRHAGDLVSLHRCETPWTVHAEALSDCKLLSIEWQQLHRLARQHPAIERALFEFATEEIAWLQDRLLTLGRKSTEEKLASFILEFCQPFSAPSSHGRMVHLPMRRPEIAEYLGLTTESISREFSRLKRERLIAMPRPSFIVVLNRPALESIALGMGGALQNEAWSSAIEAGTGD